MPVLLAFPKWIALAVIAWVWHEGANPSTDMALGAEATVLLTVAALGFLATLARLVPGAPFYNLVLSSDGLRTRRFLSTRSFTWSELSPFSVEDCVWLPWQGGCRVKAYWSYQMAQAELGDEPDIALRIDVAAFVSRGPIAGLLGLASRESATILAEWLNELRDLGAADQLESHRPVHVPEVFRSGARSLAPSTIAPPPQIEVERAIQSQHRPTVERL